MNLKDCRPRVWLLVLGFFASCAGLCFGEAAGETVLVDREISVLRGDFKELHFLVPEDMADGEFRGEFKCEGGMNDDITFYAFNQQEYVRWFSHYPYKADVKLKKQTEGKFNFAANPGQTYYFVFDNFFSSVSGKKIQFTLRLTSRSRG